MQNSVVKAFEGNPDVVTVLLDQGGARGEDRAWLGTIWDNFHLRGSILFDATGSVALGSFDQPATGLPFGRSFVIDQAGNVSLPYFLHEADRAITAISALLPP
jgi:hypothetical protein